MPIFPLLLFIFTLASYLHGISPSAFGGDSGDILTSAWFGSIAHPPGYPLNALIGLIFTHLPFQATVAYKAGLMVAVLQSATITIFYLTIKKITKNQLVALVSALTLA